MDYKKSRLSVRTLLEGGVEPKLMNIDSIAADLDMGRAWFIYRSLTRVASLEEGGTCGGRGHQGTRPRSKKSSHADS